MSPRKVGFAPIVISVIPVMVASSSGARTCPCPSSTDGATVMPGGGDHQPDWGVGSGGCLGDGCGFDRGCGQRLAVHGDSALGVGRDDRGHLGYSPASSRVSAVVCPLDQVTQRVP